MVTMQNNRDVLIILGPTASGKTRLAVHLAKILDGEILSADSRQVYRGLDIGTGKDLHEYDTIPYHLIDVVDLGEEYNLFEFKQQFFETLPRIHARNHLPILAGGTGLYLQAILQNYQLAKAPPDPSLQTLSDQELERRLNQLKPEQHNSTDRENRARMIRAIEIATTTHHPTIHPELSFLTLGMRWERALLRQRIAERLTQRLETGLIQEVEHLLEKNAPATLTALGLEYRFITRHLLGELTFEQMEQQLHQAICQFAKRQETWFRRMERQGIPIHWLNATDPIPEALQILATHWPHRLPNNPV
ncbi:MAG: tRNA (adenosine(37)-N6)-dimethylallyltransferase MiaA [Magnetococcus sp. YQC-5]